MQGAKHSDAMGIASICNAAAHPYRADSAAPISVIQWTVRPLQLACSISATKWQALPASTNRCQTRCA